MSIPIVPLPPTAITSFLSSYPHPAFILSAGPLRTALIGRSGSSGGGIPNQILKKTTIGLSDSNLNDEFFNSSIRKDGESQGDRLIKEEEENQENEEENSPNLSELPTRRPSETFTDSTTTVTSESTTTAFDPHSTYPSHFKTLSTLALPLPPSLFSYNHISSSTNSPDGSSSNGASKFLIQRSSLNHQSTNDSNTSTSSNTRENRILSTSDRNSSPSITDSLESINNTNEEAEKILSNAFEPSSSSTNSNPRKSNSSVLMNQGGIKVEFDGVRMMNQEKTNLINGNGNSIFSNQLELQESSDETSTHVEGPTHSSLLEGGSQANHDPSRTAEGAVASMYEQRHKKEEEKIFRLEEKKKSRQVEYVNSIEVLKESTNSRGVENGEKGKEDVKAVEKKNSEKEVNSREDHQVRPLGDLLKPIWGNLRWRKLVEGKEEDSEIGLLGLLGRVDAQKLLDLLTNVLDSTSSTSTPNSSSEVSPSFSLKLQLQFPFDSIHYSPLSARRSAAPSLLPNSVGDTESSTEGLSSGLTINGRNRNATLDLVVTLCEGTDYLVITTLLNQIKISTSTFPRMSRTTTEDSTISNIGDDEFYNLSTSPNGIISSAEDASTPIVQPKSRPSDFLQHHSSTESKISNSSLISDLSTTTTTSTIKPTPPSLSPSPSFTSVPTQPQSLLKPNSQLSSCNLIAESTKILDRTPNPAPQYTGRPVGMPGSSSPITTGGEGAGGARGKFPKGFVKESKFKKRSSGGGGSGATGDKKRRERQLSGGGTIKGKEKKRDEIIEEVMGGEGSESRSDEVSEEDKEDDDDDDEGGEDGDIEGDDPVNPELDRKLEELRLKGTTSPTVTRSTTTLDPNKILPSPPSLTESSFFSVSPLSLPPSLNSNSNSIFPPSTDPFLLNLMSTPMGKMIRGYAWETSPLGPILAWPAELKVMVTLCLATPFRNAIWYGPENVLIYNDEYAKISGDKHPGILGKSGAVAWSEIWDTLGPLATRVMQGETVSYYDHHLPMNRYGFVEETYYIWSFIPFRGADGTVLGYDNPCFETTARVIAERRLSTIRDLVQNTASARTVKDYCQKTLHSLAGNPYDIPFAILYTCESITPSTSKSMVTAKDNTVNLATFRLNLEGTIGVPLGHSSTPKEVFINVTDTSARESDASSDNSYTTSGSTTTTNTTASDDSWPFAEACSRRKPVFISQDLEGRTRGFERRGWLDPVKNALCIPIYYEEDASSTPRAILVVGLNPRRPWNDIFATFFLLLSRSIASGMFSVFVAETDAERANELAQLNRAKTNFFSNVSHELRTPLTLILGPLEDVLSSKESLTSIDRQRLVTVNRHATRLLNMVNTLLDFSRLEGGKMETTFRPTKLSIVTADLGSLFRSAIERGNIEYIVDCEPDPVEGASVFLSVELWEKIIFNLVGNAFKYTMTGMITLQVRYTKREAVIQVIDTGCGIPANELSSIFERFHRVESASRTREGTGIGLALTLELVKVLGGLLEVESEVGKGSTFTVRLPRGSAHLPANQVVLDVTENDTLPTRALNNLSMIDEVASWKVLAPASLAVPVVDIPEVTVSSASSSSGSRASTSSEVQQTLNVTTDLLQLNKSVILLVDDNEDLRSYISGILGKHFTVVQAADGLAALEYALATPPSLVVTDMQMPRCDGRQFLEKFRNNSATKLVPVIFLSADASTNSRIDALNAGADDFLVKPFQSRELIARVQTHLQLGRMRLELEREVAQRTEELVESEMKFRGLADRYSVLSVLSPVGVFMADTVGNLSYANPKWYAISGHHTDKPLDKWRDSVLEEDLSIVEEVWNEAIECLEGEKVHQREFRYKGGNWVQFEIQTIFENSLKVGFVGAITDISRQKKIEALHIQTVDQRAADAEENRRQMELFIDMASHELRNPLSGVWQNAEVVGSSLERITEVFDEIRLERLIPDEETLEDIRRELEENTEAVESIILCASHQGRIADDILNVSKLNMGLLSVNPTPFDLVSKMTEVLRMFEVECQQKQINLSILAGPSLVELGAEWVVADPSRLAQIVINFLTNSVKYTSDAKRRSIVIHIDAYKDAPVRGDPNRSMRVAEPPTLILSPDKVWVVVGVEDSGKGLNQEELKKLFSRFAQANPKSDQYGGSGLGLYVSRALAELHEGFIEVESAPEEGSTFKLAIPAATATAPAPGTPPLVTHNSSLSARSGKRTPNVQGAASTSAISGTTTTSTTTTSPVKLSQALVRESPLHVLVVEDNLINQKVMQRQLKMAKFVVTLAGNGQEALDAIQADNENSSISQTPPIDIVLMDIEMPIMNGLTAIRELRKKEMEGSVSRRYNVIAVTGNARQGQIDECLASGFDDVAIKPYRMVELLIQIHKLVDNDDLTPTS